VDETYCRLNGRWAYCYRAIDQEGQVVHAYFSERRNAAAARTFFERAITGTGEVVPERVVTDKVACYPPAVRALSSPAQSITALRYLINGLERDHGHFKQRLRPMCEASSILRPLTLWFAAPCPCAKCAQRVFDTHRPGRAPLAPAGRVAAAGTANLAPWLAQFYFERHPG
jgi:transposase-like protein